MIPDRSSPSRVRCAASRPGRLRADSGDVAVYEGKGMSRRPPAQISECARLIRASSSIAGTGLMSVSPPATTRVYSGASPYCLGKASRAPIWFLTRSPGGYPAMSKMTLLRPSSTSASCTNERFRNDPTPNWFSRAWGLRNGIAGEIQLAIVFCNAVREAVIQALRREGTRPTTTTPPRMESTTEVISKGHEEPRTLSPLARGLGGRVLQRVDHAVRRRG